MFSHAGLAVGHFGVNLGAVSAMEIIDPGAAAGSANSLALIRSLMYDALSLRDGIEMVKADLPGYATTVVLGDGRYELRSARLRGDGLGGLEERYDLAGDFATSTRGIIYASIPLLESAVQTQIDGYLPSVTVAELQALAASSPSAEVGNNLLNIVVDGFTMELLVSTAIGTNDAGIPDNKLDFQALLP